MSATDRTLREQSVRQHCRLLRLPTVASQFGRLAEEAMKQQYGPVRYLEALLAAELEERERSAIARRIFEAKLPRVKTLEEFDFSQAPQVSAARIHQLAEGGYIQKAEPLVFVGEPGVGKTHLAVALAESAIRAGQPAYFMTAHDLLPSREQDSREPGAVSVAALSATPKTRRPRAPLGSAPSTATETHSEV